MRLCCCALKLHLQLLRNTVKTILHIDRTTSLGTRRVKALGSMALIAKQPNLTVVLEGRNPIAKVEVYLFTVYAFYSNNHYLSY